MRIVLDDIISFTNILIRIRLKTIRLFLQGRNLLFYVNSGKMKKTPKNTANVNIMKKIIVQRLRGLKSQSFG